MGNHSTKLVEKPKNYEEHEYQGGLHIFNIEGNVEGMYMVAYFGIVFLFVMVFCLCCVMCCESRRTRRLGRRMRQTPTFDWRQFQPAPSPSVVFLNSDSMRHTQSLPTIQEVNEAQETRPSELRNDIRLSIQGPADRNNLFPAIEDQGQANL
jgi:hypothetical protein